MEMPENLDFSGIFVYNNYYCGFILQNFLSEVKRIANL